MSETKPSQIMQGFPNAEDQQVTLANWRTAPYSQWAFHHVREIVASADVVNNPANVWPLDSNPVNLGGVNIDCEGQGVMSLAGFNDYGGVDAMIVLHRDKVVYEDYRNGMAAHTPHILMSVSKSVLGMLTAILEDKGHLDTNALITDYIPELSTTGYQGATVRHLLDMRCGVEFDEDYLATSGAIIDYRKSTNWNPLEAGEAPSDLRSFYQTLTKKSCEHGGAFSYISPNTDLMAWVIERATNTRYADLLSEHLWSPMGAERNAYITVDRLGAPRAAGGLCTTLRDLAMLGRLIANDGKRDEQQILPTNWRDDLLKNGDRQAWDDGSFAPDFPDLPFSYRNKWYVAHSSPIDEATWLMAIGIHGQNIFIDHKNDFVMVKFSSHELALHETATLHGLIAAREIRDYLVNHF